MNLYRSSTIGGIRRIKGIETNKVLVSDTHYAQTLQPLYSDVLLFDWRYPDIKGSYQLNRLSGEVKLIVENAMDITSFTQWFSENIAYKKLSLQIIDENDSPQVLHFCMATDFAKIAEQDRTSILRYEINFIQSKVPGPSQYNQFDAIKEITLKPTVFPLTAGGVLNKTGTEVILQDFVDEAFIKLKHGTSPSIYKASVINAKIINLDDGTHYIFAVSKATPYIYQTFKIVTEIGSITDITLL